MHGRGGPFHPYSRPPVGGGFGDYPLPFDDPLAGGTATGPGRPDQSLIEARRQKERMSRTLFVRNVSYDVAEATLREMFEKYGEIKKLFLLVEKRGMAFITFYDIRNAEKAKKDLQSKELNGRPIDVHYSLPKDDADPEEQHNATLYVTFRNGPGSATNPEIQKFFEKWGEVKEVRDCKNSPSQKFVEYYDLRHCEQALKESNGVDFGGGSVMDVRMAYNSKQLRASGGAGVGSGGVVSPRDDEIIPPRARAAPAASKPRKYMDDVGYGMSRPAYLDDPWMRWEGLSERDRMIPDRLGGSLPFDRYLGRDDRRGIGPMRGFDSGLSPSMRGYDMPPLSSRSRLASPGDFDDFGSSYSRGSSGLRSNNDLQGSMLSQMTQLAQILSDRHNSQASNSGGWSGSGGLSGLGGSGGGGGNGNAMQILQQLQDQLQSGAPPSQLQSQLQQLQQMLTNNSSNNSTSSRPMDSFPSSRGSSSGYGMERLDGRERVSSIDSRIASLDSRVGLDRLGGMDRGMESRGMGGMDSRSSGLGGLDSRNSGMGGLDSRSGLGSLDNRSSGLGGIDSRIAELESRGVGLSSLGSGGGLDSRGNSGSSGGATGSGGVSGGNSLDKNSRMTSPFIPQPYPSFSSTRF